MAGKRRHFGSVRRLPSGRYQVRYRAEDGRMRPAPKTFAKQADAQAWLTVAESQILRGEWLDPDRGRLQFGPYAERWLIERPRLRPRTVELYELLLRRHINPTLGGVELGRITTPMIRSWRTQMLTNGASLSMAAKAYRLVRAVLNTAVREDELIRANPCRIPGADREEPEERPVLQVTQVLSLADAVPERYRALVLLSTFACLRWGEAIALTRADLDLEERVVSITKAYSELRGSVLVLGPTKSRAGVRTVSFPEFASDHLARHLKRFTGPDSSALVFTGTNGGVLRRSNFRTASKWREASASIGVPGLHFHDLRHTGNTLAAQTGVSLRDLMSRMGHDSPRAALIYQHASSGADRAVADALDLALRRVAGRDRGETGNGAEPARTEQSPQGLN